MAKANETIIASGVRIEGEFFAEGDIIIEGEVRGTVSTTGDLRVGDGARLDADITSRNAVISGEVQGTLRINGKLDLLATSKVTGDIAADVLSVEAGSQVNGTVHMGAGEVAPAPSRRRGKVSEEAS